MRMTGIGQKCKGALFPFVVLLMSMLMVGCGSSKPAVYDAGRSASALGAAGWRAKSVAGMPNTLAGVRQVGYLEMTAPDGTRIDIQFLEDATKAVQEFKAIEAKDPKFVVVTAGNALVFSADPKTAIPKPDLDRLVRLLHK